MSIKIEHRDDILEYIIKNNLSEIKIQHTIKEVFQFLDSKGINFKAELQLFSDPEDPSWKSIHLLIHVSFELDEEILKLWDELYNSIDVDDELSKHLVITLRPSRDG